MKSLGIDYGEKRIGLAISDESGTFAFGHGIIERTTLEADLTYLVNLIRTEKIEQMVIGLPKKLDNTLGQKAEEVMEFTDTLQHHLILDNLEIPIITWDERLTTVQAEQAFKEVNISRTAKRKHINTVAAQLILQGYIDEKITPH